MTVQECYINALVLIGEDTQDTSEYDGAVLTHINGLLGDLFDVNNSLLRAAGQTELKEIPTVTARTQTLPYQDELCRNVMPYGLGVRLALNDDVVGKNFLVSQYETGKLRYSMALEEPAVDYYMDRW